MQKPISPVDGTFAGPVTVGTGPSRPAMVTMPALAAETAALGPGRPSIKRTKPLGSKPPGGAV